VRIVNTSRRWRRRYSRSRRRRSSLRSFKQQFFVETRSGAGGTIGVQTVANSEPDGYNFVITTLSLAIIGPFMNPRIGTIRSRI